MARRGFVHSFFSALIAALVLFFLIYFLAPGMGNQFLGVSFASRDTVSVQVDAAVQDTMASLAASDLSQASLESLRKLFSSQEVKDRLKEAAKAGGAALGEAVQTVVDSVRQ